MPDRPFAQVLGPHVVGQRVVVRHLTGQVGPTGGPEMTDVLGICVSWGEAECVIETETGERAHIGLKDVVSGKPVPPRPSIKHRISAYDAELRTSALWPELESEPLGNWLLRAAPPLEGRRRKRANSALAMSDPGLALHDALDQVRDYYQRRGQDPLAQVEVGSVTESALIDAGWIPLPDGEATYEIASLPQLLRRLRATSVAIALEETGNTATATVGTSLAKATSDGDWLGLHGLYVDPAGRRQGLARALMAELLDWGGSLGATTVWLHVETDNVAATHLYRGLGFRTHHTARYLEPGDRT